LLRRLGTLLAFQPILLGLILLSRRLWVLGGVLAGVGCAVIVFVEAFAYRRTKLPGRASLSNVTQDSLDTFIAAARSRNHRNIEEEGASLVESTPGVPRARTRGSMASVLEMMSVTLAVTPSPTPSRGPVPLGVFPLTRLNLVTRID
jgi:calcium permeable stress-gated cation channel